MMKSKHHYLTTEMNPYKQRTAQKSPTFMSQLKIVITSVLLLMFFMAGCNAPEENEPTENGEQRRLVAVETVTIVPDSFDDIIRVSGVIEAIEDAVISSESSGRIIEIVDLGTTLKKGDTIAKMDDRLIRSSYEAAKTGYELALDTYERLSVLHADSIISTQDFNNARAMKDQAKAQLDQVSKQLEDAVITAPFSGRVEDRMVRTGELINPGMPVVRLVNTDKVRIKAGVPERFSREIRENTPVILTFRSNGNNTMQSQITFAGNIIDPDTRTYTIEIELENKDRHLKPEMVVDIQAKRRTVEEAVIIPRTAVIRDEEGSSVFVSKMEDGQKIAALVSIETGIASGGVIQITSGLQEGDEVVITGISNLSAGDRLNILNNRKSNENNTDIRTEGSGSVQN